MSKKIMFNDKYGLTNAVLNGDKSMTRRIVKDGTPIGCWEETVKCARYQVGENVAIAQSYKDLGYTKEWVEQHISPNPNAKPTDPFEKKYPGWNNKMFTHSELEKVRKIEITNINVEWLQDCSDDDILKEGVFQISAPTYRHYNGIGYTFKGWTDRGVECSSDTPKGAFKALINRTCGRGTFESNPLVFAYSFKLLY